MERILRIRFDESSIRPRFYKYSGEPCGSSSLFLSFVFSIKKSMVALRRLFTA
jgi:hypothetical protein